MNDLSNWTEVLFESVKTAGQKFMAAIPGILGAFLIFLIGWLLAKLLSSAVKKILHSVKFDKAAGKVKADEMLERMGISATPSAVVARFIYWIWMLLIIITASETLGWSAVSDEISKLISFLPDILVAVIFFIVGSFLAAFVRDVIRGTTTSMGISTGKFISGFVYYLLIVMVALTSLKQAGVDTSIITSNLLIILGTILAAAAISYGLASREVLANILGSHFGRSTFQVGQKVDINGIQGTISDISSINLTLRTDQDERVIFPARILMTSTIRILE